VIAICENLLNKILGVGGVGGVVQITTSFALIKCCLQTMNSCLIIRMYASVRVCQYSVRIKHFTFCK